MRVETFSLNYGDLDIARNALLMAMGYSHEMPSPVAEVADQVLKNGGELCDIRGGYGIVNNLQFNKSNFTVLVDRVSFRVHKIVFQQIKRSNGMAVFVCTAGRGITDRSKKLMKSGDLLQGYVYDVFGSIVVEGAMDVIQGRLQNEMRGFGLNITNRYSPGYCGWEVAEQRSLFQLLPEHFCGVELTDSCLMVPPKSISGMIGIGESVKYNRYTCNFCSARNCLYRNLNQRVSGQRQEIQIATA
jgi:Vitamin B12 dependent methionine synthase, activation domain